MNRRNFLFGLTAAGVITATPKIIIDLAANTFRTPKFELITKEFRSPSYCIKTIQSTAEFRDVFEAMVKNLYNQKIYFSEGYI